MKLVYSAAFLPLIFAQDNLCPNLEDDPRVDLSAFGGDLSSHLDFDRYCGTTLTSGYGQAKDKAEGMPTSTCRIKCKDWPDISNGEVRLFWAKTRNRWSRTKYLQCTCQERNDGTKNCFYKRKGYKYSDQQGRSGGHVLQLACQEPGCTHPDNIDEFETTTVPALYKKISKTESQLWCNDCQVNKNRGGTWTCYDKYDEEVAPGASVPWKGYCKLTCGHNDAYSISKKIKCKNPAASEGYAQWDMVWRLHKFLTKNKYKRNAHMDPEQGWVCASALSSLVCTESQFDKAGTCVDKCTTTFASGVSKCATCNGGNNQHKCASCSDPNASVNNPATSGCDCNSGFHDEAGVCVAD